MDYSNFILRTMVQFFFHALGKKWNYFMIYDIIAFWFHIPKVFLRDANSISPILYANL